MPPSRGEDPLRKEAEGIGVRAKQSLLILGAETAKHECVSEDALQHLKTYKYSSVDQSFISRYILKHYVRAHPQVPRRNDR